jgi:CheY-like chemotaxis protein
MDDLEFRKELRITLNHLHNRDYLRQSPLIELFGLTARFDTPAVLQRILTDGIEALRPPPGEPLHSTKRRIFDILLYRYIQQFKQEEVAHHIGVSNRQFRREQDNALDALALHLWNSRRLDQMKGAPVTAQPADEWEWLKNQTGHVTNPTHLISEIFAMMTPVAEQSLVRLQYTTGDLPDLDVHPIVLRQVLLNLLQAAIHSAPRGDVKLTAFSRPPFVDFQIHAGQSTGKCDEALTEQDSSLIQIATHLTHLSGGQLDITQDTHVFTCLLALPAAGGIDVLVVDDNIEIIDLLVRYAALTRYRLVGIQEPEEAVEMAIHMKARIILLDVMMPRVDGWELLGRLRQHPQTADIPVIILSILAQEELACSLGARALVLKPVTQERLLVALDGIYAEMSLKYQ